MKFRYLEKLQEKDGASVQENETLGEFPDSDKYSQKSRECYLVCWHGFRPRTHHPLF